MEDQGPHPVAPQFKLEESVPSAHCHPWATAVPVRAAPNSVLLVVASGYAKPRRPPALLNALVLCRNRDAVTVARGAGTHRHGQCASVCEANTVNTSSFCVCILGIHNLNPNFRVKLRSQPELEAGYCVHWQLHARQLASERGIPASKFCPRESVMQY
jgi:hypothetical protein